MQIKVQIEIEMTDLSRPTPESLCFPEVLPRDIIILILIPIVILIVILPRYSDRKVGYPPHPKFSPLFLRENNAYALSAENQRGEVLAKTARQMHYKNEEII